MLVATSDEWARCAGCLKDHPAFILGNGPYLPPDLTPLDDFFTVGVNRILLAYDPTVVLWTDTEIWEDIESQAERCKATMFSCCNSGPRLNRIEVQGHSGDRCFDVLDSPAMLPATGNMGVSAALWAMSLGCSPVYLLGMSAEYDGGKTNFWGVNKLHWASVKARLGRTLRRLLRDHQDAFPLTTGVAMMAVAKALSSWARGRQWYEDHFAAQMGRAA